jgi:hypothetical protein
MPGKYMGTYSDSANPRPGELQLKWSEVERRYNGTWREGEDQFGEISIRLVGDEIRGAISTDPKSKTEHARPRLGDVKWVHGAAKPPARAAAAGGPPPEPLDLKDYYQIPASVFERILRRSSRRFQANVRLERLTYYTATSAVRLAPRPPP